MQYRDMSDGDMVIKCVYYVPMDIRVGAKVGIDDNIPGIDMT
jgi:hypothetical protein